MDDLRSQIKMRGLTDGGNQSPLMDFWGDFQTFEPELTTGQFAGRLRVKLKFTNVEVLKSRTPYEFPIAELVIPHSDRNRSRWGVLSNSAVKFLAESEDIDALVGARLHLVYTPGHMLWDGRANNGQGAETAQEAWEIVEVQGRGGVSSNGHKVTPLSAALRLLDGKTEQEFNAAALRDDTIKGDSEMVSQILNRSWLGGIVTTGSAVKGEDGRYKVDQSVVAALG